MYKPYNHKRINGLEMTDRVSMCTRVFYTKLKRFLGHLSTGGHKLKDNTPEGLNKALRRERACTRPEAKQPPAGGKGEVVHTTKTRRSRWTCPGICLGMTPNRGLSTKRAKSQMRAVRH
jgi:hypothetical protein